MYLEVSAEPSTARSLSDHFTFEVPGAKFMPAYRNRIWDGKIRLYSPQTGELYLGLLSYLDPFTQPNTAEETAAETWPQVSFAKIRVGSNPNHFPFKLDNNHGGKDKFIKGINSLGDDWGKTQIPALNDDSIVRLLRSQVLHYEMALRDG